MNRLLAAGIFSSAVVLSPLLPQHAGAVDGESESRPGDGRSEKESRKNRDKRGEKRSREEAGKPVKSEKRSPASKRKADDAGADSMRTQQATADAMAKKLGGRNAAGGDAELARELSSDLAAIESRMRIEDERHAASIAELHQAEQQAAGNEKQLRRVRKAIEKEESGYQRKKSTLNEQRAELAAKLGPSASTAGGDGAR